MVDIKKTAIYGEYVINIASDGSIEVLKKGTVCDNSKATLRDIATLVGFEVEDKWTTRQLVTKLVDAISKGPKQKTMKDGHEYVDLGLPSGVKWAACNVGADRPEEYGDYFAWAETKTKKEYTKENSKSYAKDRNDISGSSRYDAARANWGGSWKMPTKEEMEELCKYCTWEWTTQNGIKGYNVKGLNGNSIFLPAAGYRIGSSLGLAGSDGFYWGSTPGEDNTFYAFSLYIYSDMHGMDDYFRYSGQSVRPVLE